MVIKSSLIHNQKVISLVLTLQCYSLNFYCIIMMTYNDPLGPNCFNNAAVAAPTRGVPKVQLISR